MPRGRRAMAPRGVIPRSSQSHPVTASLPPTFTGSQPRNLICFPLPRKARATSDARRRRRLDGVRAAEGIARRRPNLRCARMRCITSRRGRARKFTLSAHK